MIRARKTPSPLLILAHLALILTALFLPARPARAMPREEVLARAAPAIMLVVSVAGERESVGTGVVVSPDGLLLTTYKTIFQGGSAPSPGGAGRASPGGDRREVYVFPSDAKVRDEEFVKYITAHLERGVRARVVYSEAQTDLALLALPQRGTPYPALPLFDEARLKLQKDLIAIGNPTGLAYAAVPALLSASRKGLLQIEAGLQQGLAQNAGAPVCDSETFLVGLATSFKKEGARTLAMVKPASVLRQFVITGAGRGAALATSPPPLPEGAQPAADKGGPGPDAVMHALAPVFEKRLGRYQALRLYCEFLAARGQEGRAAVYNAGEIEDINTAAKDALGKAGPEATAKILAKSFPALLIANDGYLWHREGRRYALDFKALSWDVDDVKGTEYATTVARELMVREARGFVPAGIGKVRDVQATGGTLYYVTLEGTLMAVTGKGKPNKLLPRTVAPDQLVGSQGILYMIEGGNLYRYGKGQWDRGAEPIHRGLRSVVAQGPLWYGLDTTGHVYSSADGRVIDQEGPFDRIWLINKNVLGLTRKGKVLGYTVASKTWADLQMQKIEGDKISGDNPKLTEAVKIKHKGSTIQGTYKICIEAGGAVTSVTPIAPLVGGDDVVISTVRQWRFKPQPVPVCFVRVFQFVIE